MILDGQCGAFNPLLLDCLSRIFGKLKGASAVSDSENLTEDGMASSQEWIEDVVTHLHENGLAFSEKIMQTLTRERLRLKFFFNETTPAFLLYGAAACTSL